MWREEEKKYKCPKCQDKEMYYVSKPDYSGMVWCECHKVREAERMMSKSGLSREIQEKRFDNFDDTEPWQKEIKAAAIEYGKACMKAKSEGRPLPWFFISGQPGCVDSETEYFDGKGWKRIADYDGGKVLQYEPKSKKATLVIPSRYIKKDAEEMYLIQTKRGTVNQVLSSDHNFAYVTSKGNMQKKPFYEVKTMHEQAKQGFSGGVETTFFFDGGGIELTDNEIRIMCAVIADGSFRKKQRKCFVKLKKERKKERMREILSGIDYKEYKKSDGYSDFRFYAPRREKVFSEYWYGCNNHQLQIIAEEVFKWDGSENGKRKQFSTTIKETADFVQFALSSCGVRATIAIDERVGKKTCYTVIASSGKSVVKIAHDEENKAQITRFVPDDGKQYCFTVETGYLVLRRNRRIFITGNCGKTHLCTALCGAFLKKGIPVQYMQWVREARRMKSIVMERDYESEFQKFVDCEMLYIDDLLKQSSKANGLNPNEADGRLLFEILNQRLLEKKPTIISSEWRLMDDLMVYDDGIFSRVWEMADSGRFAIGVARGEDRNYRLKGKTKDEGAD